MKKIFYFIASAIVALGAVACQNEIEEGIDANTSIESLSFTAVIDDATRIALGNDGKTAWDGDDTIVVTCNEKNYEFTNTKENPNTFTCTATGVTDIIDLPISATYSYNNDGKIDSEAGFAGSVLHCASGVISEEGAAIQMVLTNSLLYFTAAVEVTFTSSEAIFVVDGVAVNELTVAANNDVQYVAIMPASTDFAYKSNDIIVKSLNGFKFGVATKYNLGTLTSAVAKVGSTYYTTIEAALEAAGTTEVITLLADATVSQQCIVKENGHTLTVTGKFGRTSKKGDGNAYVYPTTDWKIVGSTATFGNWAYGSSDAVMLQEYSTVVVIRNVKLAADTEFKFLKDGSWANGTQVGAYGGGETGDISYNSWYDVNQRWSEFKANIKNTTAGTYDLFFATDTGSWYVTESINYKEM